jgi:hypothetical protein
MTVEQIINEAADEADTMLAGIRSQKDARPVIQDWIADRHSELAPPDRQKVATGVFSVLSREGFFDVQERRTGVFGADDIKKVEG